MLTQAVEETVPSWRQRPVERSKYARLQEVAGDRQTGGDVSWPQAALGGQQEGRYGEQALPVGLAGGGAPRSPSSRTHPDKLVGAADDRAPGQSKPQPGAAEPPHL